MLCDYCNSRINEDEYSYKGLNYHTECVIDLLINKMNRSIKKATTAIDKLQHDVAEYYREEEKIKNKYLGKPELDRMENYYREKADAMIASGEKYP